MTRGSTCSGSRCSPRPEADAGAYARNRTEAWSIAAFAEAVGQISALELSFVGATKVGYRPDWAGYPSDKMMWGGEQQDTDRDLPYGGVIADLSARETAVDWDSIARMRQPREDAERLEFKRLFGQTARLVAIVVRRQFRNRPGSGRAPRPRGGPSRDRGPAPSRSGARGSRNRRGNRGGSAAGCSGGRQQRTGTGDGTTSARSLRQGRHRGQRIDRRHRRRSGPGDLRSPAHHRAVRAAAAHPFRDAMARRSGLTNSYVTCSPGRMRADLLLAVDGGFIMNFIRRS